jgi:hypothetical protein
MIFPPFEVAIKIAIAIGIGLLVGLERQWSQKDVGVRTFSITALLGCLSVFVSMQLAEICMAGVIVLVAYMNGRSLLVDRSLEMTTSVALIVTFILGVLAGLGHLFTPIASAILMTMLLAWKTELQRFAGDLKLSEIRGAVLLGLIGFVIYPLLPNRFIDSWQLLNPRQSWLIVIIVAGLGFANYVLLRIFSDRGLYYTAVLGGLVNSTATAAELSRTALTREWTRSAARIGERRIGEWRVDGQRHRSRSRPAYVGRNVHAQSCDSGDILACILVDRGMAAVGHDGRSSDLCLEATGPRHGAGQESTP